LVFQRWRWELKRISQNQDLFEADANETITVTVAASNTPYQVTFSVLQSGGQWTVLRPPTPTNPVEKRQFKMPAANGELFVILYAFPPSGQTDPNAMYRITFSGSNGTSDGPNDVLPPIAGDIDDLPYEFRLPGAGVPNFVSADQPALTAAQPTTTQPVAAAPKKPPRKPGRKDK
jgi:hypothetical protein